MFVKGKSGNPGGRPKKTGPIIEVEALAKSAGPDAIERLKYWMRQDDARASVAACNALLDRGFGKPNQTIAATITDERMVVEAPQPAESAVDWQQSYSGKPN